MTALYTVFEVQQQRHFFTAGYDLGIFDQAVRGYAHLGAPVSLMKGVHNGFGTHFSILGDHFSPIVALLGPVYLVFPHATTLLVAQGVLFAASVPSVWLFTSRKLGRVAAYLVAAAYALAWGLQAAMAADFHEVAFAVPLLAVAIERLDAGRLRTAVTAAVLLVFVKEDFGLVLAMFGLVLGIRTKRWRLAGVLAVAGVGASVLAQEVLIPLAGGRSNYYWDYYAALGPDPASALWHIVRHPLATLKLSVTPHDKVRLLSWLFAPLGFVSLASSFVLLCLPLLAERLLSANPNHWTLTHQYSAPFVPILTLAAVDGIAKLRYLATTPETGRRRTVPRVATPMAVAGSCYGIGVLAVAVWACTQMPFNSLAKPWEWQTSSYEKSEQAAVAVVPSGATVEASNWLAPHLVDRARVMLVDNTPHNAPWVVFDEGRLEFPLTPDQQRSRPGWLRTHGYVQVFSRDGLVVFHRTTGVQQP